MATITKQERTERKRLVEFCNNQAAYTAGLQAGGEEDGYREAAFPAYRTACGYDTITPSVSASVCFVAGYLGNSFPGDDSRVTG